jgi:hypothetical protein
MLLEEIEGMDFDLRPVETMLHEPPIELEGMIRVGVPDVFDAVAYATKAGQSIDPGTELLLEDSEFFLVRVPLSVRPRERVEVRFLAVECFLEGSSGPITCWSMTPERVEQEVTASTEVGLTAGLKVDIATLGVSSSAKNEYVVYQPNILAFGIGLEDPAWEFEPTKGRKLRGVQLLHLVVRAPRGTTGQGRIVIRADVVERGFIWNTKAFDREDGKEGHVFEIREP